MERGKLLNRMHSLADYALTDKQVALSRAKEYLVEYTLSRDPVVRKAFMLVQDVEERKHDTRDAT